MSSTALLPLHIHVLTAEQQENYAQLVNKNHPESASSFLAEALLLPDYKHDARSSIILEYVAWMCTLCQKLQLETSQTSAVLQMGQQLLKLCSMGMPRTEAQDLIKSSLLQLCMPSAICTSTTSNDMAEEAADAAAAASAGGTTIAACALPAHPAQLSPDAVASLAGAFTGTLLQHYTLWTFVFTQQQQHEQHQHHLMVESPVAAPPLQQALIEAQWFDHLAAQARQLEAELAATEAAERAAQEAEAAVLLAAAEAAEAAARAEQLQRKPKTLDEAVDKLVALKLEDVRHAMTADYAAKATALSARISHLEQQQQQQAAPPPPALATPQSSSHGGKSSGGSRAASAKPAS